MILPSPSPPRPHSTWNRRDSRLPDQEKILATRARGGLTDATDLSITRLFYNLSVIQRCPSNDERRTRVKNTRSLRMTLTKRRLSSFVILAALRGIRGSRGSRRSNVGRGPISCERDATGETNRKDNQRERQLRRGKRPQDVLRGSRRWKAAGESNKGSSMTLSARLDATFSALADPTRRAILARLASGEASVNDLVKPFSMSQPGDFQAPQGPGASRPDFARSRCAAAAVPDRSQAIGGSGRLAGKLPPDMGGEFPAPRCPARRVANRQEGSWPHPTQG